MTRDEFEEMMNDAEAPVKIMGIEYLAGTALRKIDPIAFDEIYWTWYHSLAEDEQADVECTE